MKIVGKTLKKALVSFLGGTTSSGTPVPGEKATYLLLTEIAGIHRHYMEALASMKNAPGDAWDRRRVRAQEIANIIQIAANDIYREIGS